MYKKITYNDIETFFHVTDGTHILYFEPVKHTEGKYRISTVHKPDIKVGTGYIIEDYGELTLKTLDNLFPVLLPNWADRSDIPKIKKYANYKEFMEYQRKFFHKITITNLWE